MKIVLIGLGSIGQRHLRNLLHLGYSQVTIVSRSGLLPAEFSSLSVYATLAEALDKNKFDTGIICTPTALHVTSLKALLKALVPNIYVEKPVSHNYAEVDQLLQSADSYKNNIKVGYDLHFDPGMMKVKELLLSNTIGKVVSINAQVGQYLPDWRPNKDYRESMSAKNETGGGVMLDLVHEFDYLYWLNGNVKTIAAKYVNSGALEIETEDAAEIMLSFTNGSIATIHLDYLQQRLIRNCLITGYNGSIKWNLSEHKVWWINKDKQEDEYSYTGYERNDRFISTMQSFLINAEDDRLTSLQQGTESLRWVLAAKQSSEQNMFIDMTTFNPLQAN